MEKSSYKVLKAYKGITKTKGQMQHKTEQAKLPALAKSQMVKK